MGARPGVATAATGVAGTPRGVRPGAEGECQQIVDEGTLARSGRAVDEQRGSGASALGGVAGDASCARLAHALKAGFQRLDHAASIGSTALHDRLVDWADRPVSGILRAPEAAESEGE